MERCQYFLNLSKGHCSFNQNVFLKRGHNGLRTQSEYPTKSWQLLWVLDFRTMERNSECDGLVGESVKVTQIKRYKMNILKECT